MSYLDAIRLLTSRFTHIKYVPVAERHQQVRRPNNWGVKRWLKALELEEKPFDVIHVTGTKGKGGTCAWTDALLRSHFRSRSIPAKVGLYTSPKLEEERDRFRIDFDPVDKDTFATRFFRVWNTILADVGGKEDEMPRYLQLLALLSADIFKHARVSVAIYEVHAGGRYDATNMWDDTVACGFNTIGLDHVPLLGDNIAEIARNKAGIMKPSCQAFSVPQTPEAYEQLDDEATKLGCPLTVVDALQSPIANLPSRANLLLPAQRNNLALAIELANAYLGLRFNSRLGDEDIAEAIRIYQWPGRFQLVEEPGSRTRWYLDIAHNDLSIPVALDWFRSEVLRFDRLEARDTASPDLQRRHRRTLIFGHQSTHRDTVGVVDAIVRHSRTLDFAFDHIVLTGHMHAVTGSAMFDHTLADETLGQWEGMLGSPAVTISASIQQAMQSAEETSGTSGSHVLIVGSSHLVLRAHTSLKKDRSI